MNQQLATVSKLPTIPQIDVETGKLHRNIVSWMPSDPTAPVSLVRALSDAEREHIRERLAVLEHALEHRDDSALGRIVTGLMLSFPSGRVSGDDARAMLAAYVSALSDLPPWAVNEAARKWTRGQMPGANTSFAPSSADLYEAATQIVQGFKYEAAMLERVLLGVVTNEPVPRLSRERQADATASVQRAIAKASLDQRAATIGENAAELLKAMPEQPKPKARSVSDALPELTHPTQEAERK